MGYCWRGWIYGVFAPTPFIPKDIVNNELLRDSNISSAITTIENTLRSRLEEILGEMKRKLPSDGFTKEKRHIALEGVFSYVHNGHPELEGIRIRLDALDQVRIEAHHCPSKDCVSGLIVQLGFWQEIESEVNDLSIWKDLGDSKAIHRFIMEEASAHPDDVGVPISLIQLSGDGPKWIEKGECDHDGVRPNR
jgi:hypothetical protein